MQWKPLGSCSLTSADLIGAMPKLVQSVAIDSSLRTLSESTVFTAIACASKVGTHRC